MHEISIRTTRHTEFVDITSRVQDIVTQSNIRLGLCTIFVPHTTAGITINENADPDVVTDMIHALDQAVPWKSAAYRHAEGNSAAHVKSSMMGHTAQVLVSNGQLRFGTWQGIYFCEFDGPRSRKAWVTMQSA